MKFHFLTISCSSSTEKENVHLASEFHFHYILSIFICHFRVVHKESGRAISTESTQKGLQFYTGTYLNNVQGRGNAIYNKYSGLCLETQNLTDSVNNQVGELTDRSLDENMRHSSSRNFQVQFFVLVKSTTNKQSFIFTWNNSIIKINNLVSHEI